jgi:hypothetical protein
MSKKRRYAVTKTDWRWGGVALIAWGSEGLALSESAGESALIQALGGLMLIAFGVVLIHMPDQQADPKDRSGKQILWIVAAILVLAMMLLLHPGSSPKIEPNALIFSLGLVALYLFRFLWLIDTGH